MTRDFHSISEKPFRILAALLILILLPGCVGPESSGTADGDSAPDRAAADKEDVPRGLRVKTDEMTPGYVYFSPTPSDTTYLIDSDGQVVHTWKFDFVPSGSVYLLDNGNLLRIARQPAVPIFKGGAWGGRIQEFTWDGELVWDWRFVSEKHQLHHDIERLPNGNILAIAYEAKTAEEVRAVGRRVEQTPEGGLWPDMVIEIQPHYPNDARIVWEWHMWDHLVQNNDSNLENYGEPSAHPERIDINGGEEPHYMDPKELKRLQALGYIPAVAQADDLRSDFLHTNAVAYNARLDQIVLSVPRYNEIWVIDHSTTTEEAVGRTGGRWGRGGDLLFRWGNPAAYGRGEEEQQRLFAQHDSRWVPDDMPGGGHLMVFNNRLTGPGGDYSSVVEISAPVDASGRYVLEEGPFGPQDAVWTYTGSEEAPLHSTFISGAHRLANGHTLITSGDQGRFFEATPKGKIVWEYWNPYSGQVRMADGSMRDTSGVFRATKIPPDHPALAGRVLHPLDPQPPIATKED